MREGGPEQFILTLAQELNDSKINLTLVSLKGTDLPESDYLKKVNKLGVRTETILWSKFRVLSVILKIIDLLKKEDIHILHTHDVRTNYVGIVAGKLMRKIVITGAHGWIKKPLLKMKFHEFLDKVIVGFFDKVIVGSEEMEKRVLGLGIPSQKVTTINYATRVEEFKSNIDTKEIKEKFNLNSNYKIVGIVGRLSEEKGHKFFLKAAQRVVSTLPKTKFLIVGEGELRGRLERLTQKMGLDKDVIFTGFCESLASMLSVIDIFVLASLYETGPITVLEAMAAGKPVVATPVGLVPEAVRHGQTGLLVPPKDAIELSKAIITLLNNEEKARSMGFAGRRLVEMQFSAKSMAQKIENVYQGLCLEN